MQCDGENAKPKRARTRQQLVRRIIDGVLGIIQRVDMEIDFDPTAIVISRHGSKCSRGSGGFHGLGSCFCSQGHSRSVLISITSMIISSEALPTKRLRATINNLPFSSRYSREANGFPYRRSGGGMAD